MISPHMTVYYYLKMNCKLKAIVNFTKNILKFLNLSKKDNFFIVAFDPSVSMISKKII